jgi:hypothetical protein
LTALNGGAYDYSIENGIEKGGDATCDPTEACLRSVRDIPRTKTTSHAARRNAMKKLTLIALAASAMLLGAAVRVAATPAGEDRGLMEITWLMQLNQGETTTWFIEEVNKKFNVKSSPTAFHPRTTTRSTSCSRPGRCPTRRS